MDTFFEQTIEKTSWKKPRKTEIQFMSSTVKKQCYHDHRSRQE